MYTVCDKITLRMNSVLYLYVRCKYQTNHSSVCMSVWWPARLVLNIQELSFVPDGAVMNMPYCVSNVWIRQ